MVDAANEVFPVNIEEELKQSYLDYAMSVIVGRALPDVRDGLKPVHRRVLYAMDQLGNVYNKPHKKSARIVGDVIGKYHPHGDSAVYDTIVRMAQPFSLRYMLIDGQGNFGSVDGDAAAAMRYTEIRMSKFAHSLLKDLEKETVDFSPNYDETEFAPVVLPTRVPNLLVNGSSGIAVGMATNIPPHNLGEIIDGCVAVIDDESITVDQLMEHIPGPDFPTAGIINGRAGIVSAYRTGRGKIYVRAKAEVEANGDRERIVVTELPYQVNKARLIEKIAELVRDKKIEGISGLRDESDKDGMRMVIEIKRNDNAEVVLNNLYSQTQMQNVFGINMVALVHGQPKVLNLRQVLDEFIDHRREVVIRRTIFDLRKAKQRAHILEGLGIALVNIDPVIALIKAAKNPEEARQALVKQTWQPGEIADMLSRTGTDACRPDDLEEQYGLHDNAYQLSPIQAQAILDLKLHRLTGLEQDKIIKEYKELLDTVHDLQEILADNNRLMAVIREELLEVKEQFNDERRSEILTSQLDLTHEDLIAEENVVVTISHAGYVKYQELAMYQAQRRGGRGKSATKVKDEDFVEHVLIANTHDTILCFSDRGKLYWLKVYQLPEASRGSRGKPIVNLLPLDKNERINAILPMRDFAEEHYIVLATAKGTVKKVAMQQFSRPRASGIIAIELVDGDYLVGADITNGKQDIMLFTDAGKVIRFNEENVRPMGRTARGVRGIKLKDEQKVIALVIAQENGAILTATENGYGKRTDINEYRQIGRGGQGVISIQVTERNGAVIGAVQVQDEEDVMLISNGGVLVRTPVNGISVIGRNTQGVRLINLGESEKLVSLTKVDEVTDQALDEADAQV